MAGVAPLPPPPVLSHTSNGCQPSSRPLQEQPSSMDTSHLTERVHLVGAFSQLLTCANLCKPTQHTPIKQIMTSNTCLAREQQCNHCRS